MPSEVQNRGAPILFDVRPLFGILGYITWLLMSTPCSESLKSNRLVVSEYEVPNFLGSQEWDICFWDTL